MCPSGENVKVGLDEDRKLMAPVAPTAEWELPINARSVSGSESLRT